MSVKDKTAREKVVRARTSLLVSNGFFGFLALQLRLVEATEFGGHKIDTMAVDGKSMFYNPEFVHSMDERETEAVVAHEIMHCCFKHFTRRGTRDPLLWNVAGDFVINLDLKEAGFHLPGEPLTLAELIKNSHDHLKGKKDKKPKKIHLCDPSLKGQNTETIYDQLLSQVPKVMQGGGKDGDGDGKQIDVGVCGGVLDAPGDSGDKAQTDQQWESAVRMAVETAKANNAGNVPGSLAKLVEQLKKPKVSWREKTRRFIDQSMIKDVSWSRLSRRSVGAGVLMPGYISDRLHHLIMIVDISGSISHEMCREMVSEAAGALDEGVADRISVLYADTKVQHVDEYVQGDIVECGKYYGGGTDFEDSFRWVKENAPDASCVIYLTDLCVSNFGEEPACPVLWATYCPNEQLYESYSAHVPFGMPIHISSTYN
jgi:predicted metal-dependent peptidase